MSADLHAFWATTNAADRIQDYFAHHFGMTSPPKYTCHLTWKGEDAPKLHCLAESAKKISKMIEDDVSLGRIKPHQCSLFARSVLAVMTTLFPGYVMVLPGPVDGPLHHLYGLLYSWFDKRNYEVLKVTQGVLRQLSECATSQVSSWPATNNMDARVASNLPIEANGKTIGTDLVHMAAGICKLSSVFHAYLSHLCSHLA